MGFQDRDYYREGAETGYVTSIVVKLILINGAVLLAELLLGARPNHSNSIVDLLALRADTIVQPWTWWRFVTAGFVHDPSSLGHILFNMFGLYCFGQPLEQRLGAKEFLRFYLLAIVLGFVVWSGAHYAWLAQGGPELLAQAPRILCFGASGAVTAAVLLFCLYYPTATLLAAFIFPVPAWLVGIVIVASNLFGTVQHSPLTGGVAYDVHLAGAAFALGYWYFGWNFSRLPGLDDLQRMFGKPQKWFKPRPPLRVHDPERYYEDLDAEADRLLEKVNREGMNSLSDHERRVLEDYSRRTRQKLR